MGESFQIGMEWKGGDFVKDHNNSILNIWHSDCKPVNQVHYNIEIQNLNNKQIHSQQKFKLLWKS